MSNTLPVRITSRKGTSDAEVFEGTVTMCGGRPFKLVRKADNSTMFPTRSAVVGAARNFAKAYGFSDVNFGETTQTSKQKTAATATKKAAKKSPVTNPVAKTPAQSATTQTTSSASRPSR
jgi:hypothetical protein